MTIRTLREIRKMKEKLLDNWRLGNKEDEGRIKMIKWMLGEFKTKDAIK